ESRQDEGTNSVHELIAAQYVRCSRAGRFEENTGIRPLLESRKTWHEPGDGCQHLPKSQDHKNIRRVTKARDKLDHIGPPGEVPPGTSQELGRSDDGDGPVTDQLW